MDDEIRRALTERLTVPVEIAGKAFGLSRNTSYEAVRSGQLPSVRVGRKIAIPTAPLRRMLGIDPVGEAA